MDEVNPRHFMVREVFQRGQAFPGPPLCLHDASLGRRLVGCLGQCNHSGRFVRRTEVGRTVQHGCDKGRRRMDGRELRRDVGADSILLEPDLRCLGSHHVSPVGGEQAPVTIEGHASIAIERDRFAS
jgi:hypothetical protein